MALFFDPGISWRDIEELRQRWPGPLILKGPLGPADAHRAVDAGVDAIQLSNHGGRQLDRCVATADLIAPVRVSHPRYALSTSALFPPSPLPPSPSPPLSPRLPG